ncbi:hypothetical protein [Phyllobacterium sp. P5_D12]
MADNPDYQVGTIAITTGTKALTGVLTLWTTAGLEKGDQFGVDGYPLARIDTVDSDGGITLLDNWRGPTLAAGTPYFIRYQADSRFIALLTQVRKLLSQPILTAFSGLTAAADKLPYFTGASTMALVDFKTWARSFLGLTMAADKLPYGTGANTMDLVDFKAWARSMLGLTPAANKGVYFTSGTAAALFDLTAAGRALAGAADAAAQKTALSLVKADVGLGNVDNTTDANKPVSTAQAAALAGKQAALGYTPINPNGSIPMTSGLGLASPNNNVYQLDAAGSVSITNGGGVLYSVGSGLLIVNDFNNGGVGVFACGGGQVGMIANVGGTFSPGTPNQAGFTNVFYESSFGRYQVQNVRGGTVAYGILFLRTRPAT